MGKPPGCVRAFPSAAVFCLLATTSLIAACAACARDAEDAICPALSAGDLVVTELRGAQSEPQAEGDALPVAAFVELYNASDAAVDLRGVVMVFRSVDGGELTRAIVRDHLELAPGAYLALSPRDADGADVAPLAPTFGYDLGQDVPGNAQLIVSACGVEIDRLLYRVLPTTGSLAFGAVGNTAPTAADNDLETAWCVQTATPTGTLGSPGAANQACEEPNR